MDWCNLRLISSLGIIVIILVQLSLFLNAKKYEEDLISSCACTTNIPMHIDNSTHSSNENETLSQPTDTQTPIKLSTANDLSTELSDEYGYESSSTTQTPTELSTDEDVTITPVKCLGILPAKNLTFQYLNESVLSNMEELEEILKPLAGVTSLVRFKWICLLIEVLGFCENFTISKSNLDSFELRVTSMDSSYFRLGQKVENLCYCWYFW
jgi:hypothetical protein